MQKGKSKTGPIAQMIKDIKDGDRIIWIVVVLLMMLSIVAIFSSTSLMAIREKVSRVAIFWGQIKIVALGMAIILLCTVVHNIRFFRGISRWGFLSSLLLLLMLDTHIHIGSFIRALNINGAYRAISVGGFSLQVFEVVKVAMVMYLAWAIQTYESGKFHLALKLGTKYPDVFGWLKGATAQRWVFIFLPMVITVALIFPGSTGSALLTGIVMFATVIIGGLKWKDLIVPVIVAAAGVVLLVGIHIVSSGQVLPRMETAFNRLKIELPYPDAQERAEQKARIAVKTFDPAQLKPGTKQFRDYLDEIRQPAAAEIAIVQGGRAILGKGPGKSTQKYIVPVMFEDYMFSFIVEEYGLLVGFLIIIMYMSLFARGAIIVHNSTNRYATACVGGLVFLITFQALFHIMVNCNIGVLTGQTLPLISHGRCSFICFSFAFGVILCISKMANNKIKQQQKAEGDLMARDENSVNMEILDSIDDQLEALANGETLDDLQDAEKDINEI